MKRFSVLKWTLAVSAMVFALGSCKEEEIPATISGLPEGDVTFLWDDTESKTVTVESNYDWTYEETDEHGIIELSREEGSNELVITPNINYASKQYTATVKIVAGTGSASTEKTISVTQGANDPTYLIFADSDIAGQDNPIILFESDASGEPTVKEFSLSTNNVLSLEVSVDQDVVVPVDPDASAPATKVEIPEYGWMSYEFSEKETADGVVTVLTLTCQMNESISESKTVAVEVISGSEEIDNDIVKKRIGLVSMPSVPTIVVNPSDELTFDYDATDPQTFSVAANIEYKWSWFTTDDWGEDPVIKVVEDNGNVKVYSVSVQKNMSAKERIGQVIFEQTDAVEGLEPEFEHIYIKQSAAPKAEVTVGSTELIFNNNETEKILQITASIPSAVSFECTDDSGEDADWFSAEYNESASAVVVSVNAATEEEHKGKLKVTVGEGTNSASAEVSVLQLATVPAVVLDPASVQLNQSGDAVTVSVITNQDSWSVDASVSDEFTLVENHENNTITISGTQISSGQRSATYVVTAGEATAELTVLQNAPLKVGDPYVVNGKVVGIVYEVDEQGMHGKAFSLTVRNITDLYFFKGSREYWDMDLGVMVEGDDIDDNALPLSTTDGRQNSAAMKNEPDWQNKFQMLKWVEDLSAEQGVDWYIPAIEELKVLMEYMSDSEFIVDETGSEILNPADADKIEAARNSIRDVYKTYTNAGQYVVFQLYTFDSAGTAVDYLDNKYPTEYDDNWNVVKLGDDYAYRWISSTVMKPNGYIDYFSYTIHTINDSDDPYAKVYNNYVPAEFLYNPNGGAENDYDQYGCSVHPICQF